MLYSLLLWLMVLLLAHLRFVSEECCYCSFSMLMQFTRRPLRLHALRVSYLYTP